MGTFPVGANPGTITFDGSILWTTYGSFQTPAGITRLRASDGASLGDVTLPGPLGVTPGAAVFDGTGMWFTALTPNFIPLYDVYRF